MTNTLSVNEVASLSAPALRQAQDDVVTGRDPHDPKDPTLLKKMGDDPEVRAAWKRAFDLIAPYRYAYNWSWLGRPAIQFPQDMVALHKLKPIELKIRRSGHPGAYVLLTGSSDPVSSLQSGEPCPDDDNPHGTGLSAWL